MKINFHKFSVFFSKIIEKYFYFSVNINQFCRKIVRENSSIAFISWYIVKVCFSTFNFHFLNGAILYFIDFLAYLFFIIANRFFVCFLPNEVFEKYMITLKKVASCGFSNWKGLGVISLHLSSLLIWYIGRSGKNTGQVRKWAMWSHRSRITFLQSLVPLLKVVISILLSSNFILYKLCGSYSGGNTSFQIFISSLKRPISSDCLTVGWKSEGRT